MNLYSLALFIHLLGVISLFGAFVLMQHSGRRLRHVTTWQEARPWLDLLRSVNGMVIGGLLMMLVTGLYMSRALWSFSTSWVACGIVGTVLLMILEPLLVGRKLGQLRRSAEENQGVIPSRSQAILAGAPLWSPIHAMNGAALGMVWMMSGKPGWTLSILIPLVFGFVGALVGIWASGSRSEARREAAEHRPREVAEDQPQEDTFTPPLAGEHRAR